MDTDIVVVGAGVLGLAVASRISEKDRSVIVLEQHESFGRETSSRNSEVIHAGIYYPPGSLKAKLCVEGAQKLYALCVQHAIPHRKTGKLIVATEPEEIASLETLASRAKANGAAGIRMVGPETIKEMEPHVRAVAALFSPETGIIDSHLLMKHYEQKSLARGVLINYNCKMTGASPVPDGYEVIAQDASGENRLQTRMVVNCAGLHADRIAQMAGMDIDACGYRLHFCKGEYFSAIPEISRRVNGLVYPSPLSELTGLGIHATKDLGGRLKFGPNAFYVDSLDYSVNPDHAGDFLESARKYLPFLSTGNLVPDMAGIRPKLQGPGQPFRDFEIRHEADRGLPGWINLVGMESPGLTSSLAIADSVERMIAEYL